MHSRRTDRITTTTFEGAKGQVKCSQISAGYKMQVSSRHKWGRLHKSFTKPPEYVSGSVVKNIDFSLHFDTERFETVAVLTVFTKLQKFIYTCNTQKFPV